MEALAVDKDATIENKAAVTAAINALSNMALIDKASLLMVPSTYEDAHCTITKRKQSTDEINHNATTKPVRTLLVVGQTLRRRE